MTATASGKRAWAGRVTVAKNGEKKLLHVPLLFSASQQEGTDASEVAPVDVGEDSSLPPADGRGGPSGRAVVGLVLAGAGVVGLGVGAGFGIAALGKKSDSNAYCGQNGAGANDCYGAGYDLRKSAAVNGNVSTALFAVGTAFVVSGLLLWLTAPKRNADVANEVARARLGWAF